MKSDAEFIDIGGALVRRSEIMVVRDMAHRGDGLPVQVWISGSNGADGSKPYEEVRADLLGQS